METYKFSGVGLHVLKEFSLVIKTNILWRIGLIKYKNQPS